MLDMMKVFSDFGCMVLVDGVLDCKIKILIVLVLGVVVWCDVCIGFYM